MNVHFLSRGSDAIRFGQGWLVNLWLIATDLPDMSGFDLAQMLRHRKPGVRIFIVGNEYDVEDEIETLSLGLTKYLCKPLDDSWINCWGQPQLVAAESSGDVSLPFFGGDISGSAAEEAIQGAELPTRVGTGIPVILPFAAQPHRRPAA